MQEQRTVLLGVTGGIAAYKSAYVASGLVKKGYQVRVIMTKQATQFVSPLTFATLTGHQCYVDTFDEANECATEHIALAKQADIVLVAPATANVIAKMANGIADDMLTTVVLAARCRKLVAPAMNTAMLENSITQDNIAKLKHYGFDVLESAEGRLACGDVGKGKMPEPDMLIAWVDHVAHCSDELKGKRVLVTAGPTREAIDPVRYITNYSTGKMGYALARMACRMGAEVTLISGPTNLAPEPFVEQINVVSAREMFDAVTALAPSMDVIIKAAAVADYRPQQVASEKMKKHEGDLCLALERTDDILRYLGEHKREGQFLCGFSMETEHVLEHSREKLTAKHVDMICANSVREEGAGFGVDTNRITILTSDEARQLPLESKDDVAYRILQTIARKMR